MNSAGIKQLSLGVSALFTVLCLVFFLPNTGQAAEESEIELAGEAVIQARTLLKKREVPRRLGGLRNGVPSLSRSKLPLCHCPNSNPSARRPLFGKG